jgi:hypothetical protein
MIHIPNNIRFRFCDADGDAQIIVGKHDYNKMVKKFVKGASTTRSIAVQYLHHVLVQEIVRTYGKPSKVTLILDDTSVVIQ